MNHTTPPERSLSIHELGFVDMDGENSPQVISGVCTLSQVVELSVLKDRLQTFIESHPHYRCRIIPGDSPGWCIDSHFDLSHHCVEIDAPSSSSHSIVSLVAEQAAKGFSSEHPPWRCTLITSRHNGTQDKSPMCAIAFSAHHAFIDGLEGFELLNHLFDQNPSRSSESSNEETTSQTEGHPTGPSISWNCVKAVSRDLTNQPVRSPLTGVNSSERRTVELTWSRQQIKKARRRYGASFQELMLTVLSHGLRRYCEQRNQVCDVRAILPLGRAGDPASGAANSRHDPGLIKLPLTAIHAEPCIEKIRLQLEALRRQQKQQVFTTMVNFFERLPRATRARAAQRWTGTSSLLISLIPGPLRLPQIAGSTVESIFALPALAPSHAMAIGIVSLRETVCVAIHFDPAILDDPTALEREFTQAYHDLIVQ